MDQQHSSDLTKPPVTYFEGLISLLPVENPSVVQHDLSGTRANPPVLRQIRHLATQISSIAEPRINKLWERVPAQDEAAHQMSNDQPFLEEHSPANGLANKTRSKKDPKPKTRNK